jgi:hypothetical protein
MIAAQANCHIAGARVLLDIRSRETGQSVTDVARAVVARSTDFYREPRPKDLSRPPRGRRSQ